MIRIVVTCLFSIALVADIAFAEIISVVDSVPCATFVTWYDTYLNSSAPTTSYQTGTELILALQTDGVGNITRTSNVIIVPTGLAAGYLLDTGMTVDSMKLYLYCTRSTVGGASISSGIYGRVMKSRGFANMTWDYYDDDAALPWTTAGGTSTSGTCTEGSTADITTAGLPSSCYNESNYGSQTSTSGQWNSYKLITTWQSWYAGTSSEYGVLLRMSIEEGQQNRYDTIKFASKDHGTASYRPFVMLYYHYTLSYSRAPGELGGWDSATIAPDVASWTNETGCFYDDASYATHTSTDNTTIMIGRNFGFSLPANVTVNNVEIRILGMGTSNVASRRYVVYGATKDGSTLFAAAPQAALAYSSVYPDGMWIPATNGYPISGISKSEVENSNFGVTVRRVYGSAVTTVYIDQVQARVNYSYPASSTGRRRRIITGWHTGQS